MDRRASLAGTAATLGFLLGLRLYSDFHSIFGGPITASVASAILGGVVGGIVAGVLSEVSYHEGNDGAVAAGAGALAFPVAYGLLAGPWPAGHLDPTIEFVSLQWRILIPALPLVVGAGYVFGHVVARFRHLD